MASSKRFRFSYPTPLGPMAVTADGAAIIAVQLPAASQPDDSPSTLANRCATEVLEYLAGKRMAFDLPLRMEGTPFQRRVWRACEAIPYGQTRTPADIAEAIGEPSAWRSVGAALRANELAILVPAHRVVPARGIAGQRPAERIQRALLGLERRFCG